MLQAGAAEVVLGRGICCMSACRCTTAVHVSLHNSVCIVGSRTKVLLCACMVSGTACVHAPRVSTVHAAYPLAMGTCGPWGPVYNLQGTTVILVARAGTECRLPARQHTPVCAEDSVVAGSLL